MSEIKKRKISEQENLKRVATDLALKLSSINTFFSSSMLDEFKITEKQQIISLTKSYLRKLRKSLVITKKMLDKDGKDSKLIKQKIKSIDVCSEQISIYSKSLLEEQRIKKTSSLKSDKEDNSDVLEEETQKKLIAEEEAMQKDYSTRLECLTNLKIKYDKLLAKSRRNYRILERVIELNYESNNCSFLPDLLNKLATVSSESVSLLKIIDYIEKVIRLEKKELRKKQKASASLAGNIDYGDDIDTDILFDNEEDDLFDDIGRIYLGKISNIDDLEGAIMLLNSYPELYEIEDNKGNYIFEYILEKYFNIIINRNISVEKVKDEIDYLEKLIRAHINYGTKIDNDFYNIVVSKIDHVSSIYEKNNYETYKQKEIFSTLSKLSDLLEYYKKINKPRTNKKKHEAKDNVQIITIDNEKAKIFEDALSVRKEKNAYYLTLYVTDVASFVIRNSLEDLSAKNEFLTSDNRMFKKEYYRRFSLLQGRKRFAYAYTFELTKGMDVREFSVEKVKIRVSKNFNFKQAEQSRIDKKNKYYDTLNILTEISRNLINEYALNIKKYGELTASDVLETQICFMKNHIAKYCQDNKLPLILQNRAFTYGVGDEELIDSSTDNRVYSSIEVRDLCPTGEFTSPARSYISLFNQRLHNRYFISNKELTNEDIYSLIKETKEMCDDINTKKYGYQKKLQ